MPAKQKSTQSDLPEKRFASQESFRKWLTVNYAKSTGFWMVFSKKGVKPATVTYAQAVDEALCFGWIDGQKMSRDEDTYKLRFTPRSPRSVWSQINQKKVADLAAVGRMTEGGRAAIAQAKANGQWEKAYAPQSQMQAPEDFLAALDENAKAKAFFGTIKSASRFALFYRILSVKKPETRARKIREFVVMLERGEAPYLFKDKK
jgi:uncharacterized protein YdeI (YjbR/CyaY-like superfamily)